MINKKKLIKDLEEMKHKIMFLEECTLKSNIIDEIIDNINKGKYNVLCSDSYNVDEFYEEYTNKHSEDIKT